MWPLAFLALLPITILGVRTSSRRRAFFSVWLVSSLFWLWVQRWILEVAGFGHPVFSLYLGLWPALYVVLLSWLAPQSQAERVSRLYKARSNNSNSASTSHTEFSNVHPIPVIVLAPMLWVCLELLRCDVIASGYPWFKLGLPLVNVPLMCQSADLLGEYYLSFTTALFAGLLVDLMTLSMFRRGRLLFRVKFSITFVVLVQVFALVYGIYRINGTSARGGGRSEVLIAAVQTNVAVNNKMRWTIADQIRDFKHFLSVTRSWAAENKIVVDAGDGAADNTAAGGEGVGGGSVVGGGGGGGGGYWVPDLIVWPESMVPGLGLNSEMLGEIKRFENETGVPVTGDVGVSGLFYDEELRRLAREVSRPLLVGAVAATEPHISIETVTGEGGVPQKVIQPESGIRYNSAYLYLPDGTQSATRYDKIELTPFGEYIPIVYRWPVIEDFFTGLAVKGLKLNMDAGTDVRRFEVPIASWGAGGSGDGIGDAGDEQVGTLVVATPICFESMVSRLCRRLVWEIDDSDGQASGMQRAADILIAVTNDGWFANNKDGRMQHIQLNQMRCIENRVPMVQAANTGISAYIDSAGYVIQLGPNYPPDRKMYNDEGVMFAKVQLDSRRPLFATVGNTFAWLCLVGIILMVLIRYA